MTGRRYFSKMGIRYSILRSIVGILAGLLMIMWPSQSIRYLVMVVGALFILSGIYALILYFRKKEDHPFVYPVVSAASMLLGLWLVCRPSSFADILMYIWGSLLVLAGIQQIASLVIAAKWRPVAYGFYVLPALIAIAGIVIMVHPGEALPYTLTILGLVSLLYGINELIGWYKFRPPEPAPAAENQDEAGESPEILG